MEKDQEEIDKLRQQIQKKVTPKTMELINQLVGLEIESEKYCNI